MDELTYLNFDLWIVRGAEGYIARGRDSSGREAAVDFRMPFCESEVEEFWRRIVLPGARASLDSSTDASKSYGGSLFAALFHGELLSCFRCSLEQANLEGKGLRILLRLTAVPELAQLPWEYLYDGSRFFALSWKTPVVRFLEQPKPLQLLTVQPPLKMLVVIASPSGFAPLDGDQEWQRLNGALGSLKRKGLIQLQRLEEPTLPALQHHLRRNVAHIVHFIGHGEFDERSQEGVLILEDESGRGQSVRAEALAVVLHDHAPRLVVLNVCEGARASRRNLYSGVAQALIRQEVPAVVALHEEILDELALTLAQEFYSALADGFPVDACLAEARKVLAGGHCVAWGTPVLYLRAPDGRILGRGVQDPGDRTAAAAALNRRNTGGFSPRLRWAGLSALVLVAWLWVLFFGPWRDSPVEKNQNPPELRRPESGPSGETGAETAAPPLVAHDRGAEDGGTKSVKPEAGRTDSAAEQVAEEISSDAPGQGSRRPLPPDSPAIDLFWPRGAHQGEIHRNDRDGLDYVWIPRGRFLYGCSKGDDLCEDDEKPRSEQEIERGFWLGRTEVTVGAYKRFRDHASLLPQAPSFNVGWKDGAQPMVSVSRAEAARFCEWAATRLPTEIEWEYAARAGERRALPPDVAQTAWFADLSDGRPHAVSQKEPNAYRLYDMLGNAAEWVAPGEGQPAGSGVLRGGSWNHAKRYLRFSFRLPAGFSERSEMYGFRCLADSS